ncbi:MAG: rod shape-determining protein MreD [Muribaculaceae bacterium]|nr:rod shape-determining protein MreD [Muribaculaceae bacterium]
MNKEVLLFFALFIALVLAQVLICNHIILFNVAVPIIFIYFIIRLPTGLGLNWLFTFSFLLGFSVDIFSDTPGVNALACTLLAVCKRPMLYAYVPRDDRTKDIIPSLSSLGPAVYAKYLLTMVAAFCLMAFSIEYFNFANVSDIAIMASASCVFSFVLLLGLDSLMLTKS